VRRGELRYEPALDGLRAVAVLAVMLYHGQVTWARGGFLGVDLFFVLSGYLITTLLLSERARRGTINLGRFWARRARRLLPALFLVLLAVSLYSGLIARPSQRNGLRLDALSTLGYVANWRLALGHESYFAQYSDPSPLRHMWSLGIEEQYYLLFPGMLLLWLAWTAGRRRLLQVALLAGAVASALAMAVIYDPQLDPSRAYYGTDTRAQALLVGAALAVWAIGHPPGQGNRIYLRAGATRLPLPGWGTLAAAGMAGFVALVALARDLSPWLYRGGFLMTAVAFAGLIIGSVRAPPGGWIARGLSWSPLRATGVISYGLYLWHWPIYVVLTPDRTGLGGYPLLALRMSATFLVAALSYHLVERPIRYGTHLKVARRAPLFAATAASVAFVAGAVLLSTSGATPILPVRKAAAVVPPAADALRVMVLGDSVAYGLWHDFDQATDPHLIVRGSTQLGCGLIAVPLVVDGQVEPMLPACREFDARWPKELEAIHPDVTVLMLGIGEQYDRMTPSGVVRFGTREYEQFLDRELDWRVAVLGRQGLPVVLLTVPCHRVLESGTDPHGRITNDLQRVHWLNDVQRRYAAAHPDTVRLIDLYGLLCSNGYTDTLGNVSPVHTDGLHLSPAGVQFVWRWLGPQLRALKGG
jgi:peptidoglycan/LPS O-acetylase OafA/YrhL